MERKRLSLLVVGAVLLLSWFYVLRPRVRRATSDLLEAARVLLVVGLSMQPYFAPPPVA